MLKIHLAGNKPMSGKKSCPGAGSWLKGTDGEREGTMDPNQMKFISLIPSQFAGDTHTIAYIYIVGLVDGPLDTTSFTRSAVPFRAQYCPWLWTGSCARTSSTNSVVFLVLEQWSQQKPFVTAISHKQTAFH